MISLKLKLKSWLSVASKFGRADCSQISRSAIYEKLTSESVVFIVIINQCFQYSLVMFSCDTWQEVGGKDNLNGAGALNCKTLCKLHHCSGSSKVVEELHPLLAAEGLSGTLNTLQNTHWFYQKCLIQIRGLKDHKTESLQTSHMGNKADSPGKDLLSIGHDSLPVKGNPQECGAEDWRREWV